MKIILEEASISLLEGLRVVPKKSLKALPC